MAKRSTPNADAPGHLHPATQAWFRAVAGGYILEEHHLRLLTLAGEAWDRCVEARGQLTKDGLTVAGREGLKAHPCVAIERDARAAFARLLHQLGLDDVDAPKRGPGRPAYGLGITYERANGLPERPLWREGKRPRKSVYEYD
jgi:phage terminase small subunit